MLNLSNLTSVTNQIKYTNMKSNFKLIFIPLTLVSAIFSTAHASIQNYDVEGIFYEPMTQSVGNTIFTGSFDWDSDTDTLSGLTGVMNSSMYSMNQNISLNHHLATSIDQNGIVTASVFKENTTDVFSGGGYVKGGFFRYGNSSYSGIPADGNTPNDNAYFSFSFDKADMSGVLDSIVYADCTPGGMMQQFCMTGSSFVGTMNAIPMSLSITEVSAVPVPAAAWLFGGALMSLMGVNRRNNILPA